jgi:hypothetical protein
MRQSSNGKPGIVPNVLYRMLRVRNIDFIHTRVIADVRGSARYNDRIDLRSRGTLQWFTEKLEFEKGTDLAAPGMRWLTIAPRKQQEIEFVLASWFPMYIGKSAPCVVETADCRSTYQALKNRGTGNRA